MLAFTSGPVTVIDYETGSDRESGEPMKWGKANGGGPVEFVVVRASGEDELRRFTVDPALNGERADRGESVSLVIESRLRREGRSGRDGRVYTATVRKDRVVGMVAAGSGK